MKRLISAMTLFAALAAAPAALACYAQASCAPTPPGDGYQRSPYENVAPGYGISHGPGYGYVGGEHHVSASYSHHAQSAYGLSYSAYDRSTYAYDSGWVEGPLLASAGTGHVSQASYSDSGWRPAGGPAPYAMAQTCPHPGAIVCFPAVHSGPVTYAPGGGYYASPVALQPETVGSLGGGVGGFESYGGFGGGGATVFIDNGFGDGRFGSASFVNSAARSSAFASARASAFASGRVTGRPGKGGYGGGGKGH